MSLYIHYNKLLNPVQAVMFYLIRLVKHFVELVTATQLVQKNNKKHNVFKGFSFYIQ